MRLAGEVVLDPHAEGESVVGSAPLPHVVKALAGPKERERNPRFRVAHPRAVQLLVQAVNHGEAGIGSEVANAHSVLLKGKRAVLVLEVGLNLVHPGASEAGSVALGARDSVPSVLHSGVGFESVGRPVAELAHARRLRVAARVEVGQPVSTPRWTD